MAATGSEHPIVVGYDGSSESRDALTLGVALAAATGDPLVLACAHTASDDRGAQAVLARVTDLRHSGLPQAVERRTVPGQSAAAALQELAEAEHPRAIVLGSHHKGQPGRVLAASVAERLLHGSPSPIAIAPRGLSHEPPASLRTVCAAFDGRPESWAALQRAAQIAASANAGLRILWVLERSRGHHLAPHAEQHAAEARREAEIELARAAESVSQRLHPETRLVEGNPARVLAHEQDDVDLLVVGSRGYGPVRRVLLGGVSTALVRNARSPVMVVPRTAEFDPGGEGLAAGDELATAG